jgi:tetratricopeptide (TPR) repeat protein
MAHPDELAVWHGQYVMERGNYELAQDYFRKALDSNAQNAEAYHGIAESALALQQWSAAVSAFQQALRNSDMHLLTAYDGLGNAYSALGQDDQAIYAFQQAIQVAKAAPSGDIYGNVDLRTQADAQIGLGLLLVKQRQCELAISFLQEGQRLMPDDTRASAGLQACERIQVF